MKNRTKNHHTLTPAKPVKVITRLDPIYAEARVLPGSAMDRAVQAVAKNFHIGDDKAAK